MTMMRGGCEHVKSMVTSCSHTMNTREHHGRRLSAKNSGRRWTRPAVPMGAGGRPPSVGKLVTSSFSWAGSGVLDGYEVGADRRKHWCAQYDLSAQNKMPTDTYTDDDPQRDAAPLTDAVYHGVFDARLLSSEQSQRVVQITQYEWRGLLRGALLSGAVHA